jgi:hypothetical protein
MFYIYIYMLYQKNDFFIRIMKLEEIKVFSNGLYNQFLVSDNICNYISFSCIGQVVNNMVHSQSNEPKMVSDYKGK